jgi:hypothetical protein
MSYLPQPDSLAARVCALFARNPEDELSAADIALKFDVTNVGGIKHSLAQSVATGLLTLKKNLTISTYSAGPRLAEALSKAEAAPGNGGGAPATGGFYAWLARNGQTSAEGRAPTANTLPPPDSLVIEQGVPMPTARAALGAQYAAVFADMGPGDSFKVPTSAAPRMTANAANWGKSLDRKFAMRKIDATHSRVWRTK